MKKFWNWIRDETAPDARILRLEGAIAEESWFDDEVTPPAAAPLPSGSIRRAETVWPRRKSTICSWIIRQM